MKSSRFIPVTIALAVLLALSAGLSAAQGPAPQGGGQPQAQLGSAFTYQGQLQKDGSPINATCAMTFTVYDDATAGNLLDSISSNVEVSDGLFTQALDFGSSLFTGDARWLEVAVKCPDDAAASTLTPRQALTAAPYALSLWPGAEIIGSLSNDAVLIAQNTSPSNAQGVWGWASATSGATYGVLGSADSTAGTGVFGYASAATGNTYGVVGQAASSGNAAGVYGWAPAPNGAETYGVYGRSDSPTGAGVLGRNAATGGAAIGVYGRTGSDSGLAVYGYADAPSGDTLGVYGRSDSPAGRGVYGYALATSGGTYGVYGRVNSSGGVGVYGTNTSTSSGVAIYGEGPNAVVGDSSTPNYGAVVGRNLATTGTGMGVYGSSASSEGYGVYGYASANSGTSVGVRGISDADQGSGVYGVAYGNTALAAGVKGESYNGAAAGVAGIAWQATGTNYGVFGQAHSTNGYAGYFSGNVHVNGTLTAANKLFRIDHPLDPANQYLYHYSVESAEVLNQYSGNVVLDGDGSAWVELPAWFGAINRDIRYQLTPVGAAAPGLYIAQEVHDNRFRIAGGPPGLKVSWMITAVRNDPYIQHYGAPVEVEKPAGERGTYLFPALYGQPRELGYDYQFGLGRPATVPPQADLPAPDAAP